MSDLDMPRDPFMSGHGVLMDIWLKPIRPSLDRVSTTIEKPLAEMTMPDLLAWFNILGYGALTGYVLGTLAGNLLSAAFAGPRVRVIRG
jgi:hypothetical protein